MDENLMPARTREAYKVLKRRIIELDLKPGASFTEGQIASALGLSKTPVREALVHLRQEGLVDAVARSGYRVTPVTLKQARDLFQLRALLEVEAAGMAAERATDVEALVELERLAKARYDATEPNSISRFMQDNTRFHVTIAELSGNRMLAHVLEHVLEQLERLFHLGLTLRPRPAEGVHEHHELLAAIKGGDVDGARRVAAEQAAATQLMLLDALLSSDVVLSANIAALAE